jgi:hypothetical protein
MVTKTPAFLSEVGAVVTLKRTVKEHSEFRGEKQTVLQRVAVVETKAKADA